jgi:hypothetical protein
MTCAWFELLSRIPFSGLRLRLCRWHADGCPRCRHAGETGETPPWLITAGHLLPGLDLWPVVKQGIDALPRKAVGPLAMAPQPARRSWRWAYAAAMLLLAFFAGYLVFFLGRGMQPHPGPVAQPPAAQTRLCSAKIAERPARVFQVQSRNPDRKIFWIAKGENRS